MAIDLSLTQVQVPGARTNRPSINVGAGLQSIGNSLTQFSNMMAQRNRQQQIEDPEVALNLFINQKQRLNEGMNSLMKITDPDELQAQASAFIKESTGTFAKEFTQAGVPKSGATKIQPALITALDTIQRRRTELLNVAGQQKLQSQRATLLQATAGQQVTVNTTTVEVGADGTGSRTISTPPTISYVNTDDAIHELNAFGEAAIELAQKYDIPLDQVLKSFQDDQAMVSQELIIAAANQIPEFIMSPEFKHLPFFVEQITVDPISKEVTRQPRQLLPSEMEDLRKRAATNLASKQQVESHRVKELARQETQADERRLGDITANFGNIPLDDLIEAVSLAGHPSKDEFGFHDSKVRRLLLQDLYAIRRQGGFAQTDDPLVSLEVDAALQSGETFPPREFLKFRQDLSESTFNRYRELQIRNLKEQRTEVQKEIGRQQRFIDEFLGNLEFVKIRGEVPPMVAAITKQNFRSRALQLIEQKGTATPEELNKLAFQSLNAQKKTLFEATGFKDHGGVLDRLAQFSDTDEIDAAFENEFDLRITTKTEQRLAKDLLSFAKGAGELIEKRKALPEATTPKKSTGEKIKEIWKSFKEATGEGAIGQTGLNLN